MEGGQFDLKGLVEYGIKQALGKFDLGHVENDIIPMVGPVLSELKMPHMLEIGILGTLFGRALIAGLDRQRAISQANGEARKVKNEPITR